MARKQAGGWGNWLFGVGAAGLLAGVIALGIFVNSSGAPSSVATTPPKRENCSGSLVLKPRIEGVEHFDCKGQNHVADGTRVTYDQDPPLSGDHWAGATPPGFYEPGVQEAYWLPERLVHALEHGNVVIYYNPEKVTAAQKQELKDLARKWPGAFAGVVVVPRNDEKNPIILTAWEYVLRLPAYDKEQIDRFVREFISKGPENAMAPK
jgi:hypothetical protein